MLGEGAGSMTSPIQTWQSEENSNRQKQLEHLLRKLTHFKNRNRPTSHVMGPLETPQSENQPGMLTSEQNARTWVVLLERTNV